MIESVERQLDELLTEFHVLHWKDEGLSQLIKYAESEKKFWEERKHEHATNMMIKIIGIAKSLQKLKDKEQFE